MKNLILVVIAICLSNVINAQSYKLNIEKNNVLDEKDFLKFRLTSATGAQRLQAVHYWFNNNYVIQTSKVKPGSLYKDPKYLISMAGGN
jgi:hypothetical protein